jgi:rRNA maturation RNase YbeY
VSITVDIITDEGLEIPLPFEDERLRKYAVHVLESSGCRSASVNIVFIDDAAMSDLNEQYKKREGSTDVLSFDLSDDAAAMLEGEVYVSLERARQQADELSVPFDGEIVRLVTHGLLHLAGRTHGSDDAYAAMTAETERFTAGF